MRCRNCLVTFDARTAELRGNHGTGGSDHPVLFLLPAGVVAMAWVGLRVGFGESGPLMVVFNVGCGVAEIVTAAGGLVAYTDAFNAVCPRCGSGGHTRWPWSR